MYRFRLGLSSTLVAIVIVLGAATAAVAASYVTYYNSTTAANTYRNSSWKWMTGGSVTIEIHDYARIRTREYVHPWGNQTTHYATGLFNVSQTHVQVHGSSGCKWISNVSGSAQLVCKYRT